MERKYVSLSKLSHFLSKLRTIFSDINHMHTVADIENLQNTFNDMQKDIDALEQTVADLEEGTLFNIVPITQDEYNALTNIDEKTLYIIEV